MKRTLTFLTMILLVLCFLVPPAMAATPSTLKPNLWKDKNTFQGPVDFKGTTVDFTGSTPSFDAEEISATDVANVTRYYEMPLGAAFVDGTGPITNATAPNLTTLDNVGKILYDDSSEVAPVQWTFVLQPNYVSGLEFYAIVSSNDASGTGTKVDWAVTVNGDDTSFGSPTAQDLVECTSATLDASHELLTFTPDATLEALLSAGATLTFELFNASTNDDDLEIMQVYRKEVLDQ